MANVANLIFEGSELKWKALSEGRMVVTKVNRNRSFVTVDRYNEAKKTTFFGAITTNEIILISSDAEENEVWRGIAISNNQIIGDVEGRCSFSINK